MNRLSQYEQSMQAAGRAEQLWKPSPFRARSRWQSFGYAVQGLRDAWETQANLRLHVWAGLAAIAAGAWFRLSAIEWLWISFAIGLVIFAELMNTAIEQTVDFVVGDRLDPAARCVKDIAAGFVLVACLIAVVIGALTFGPHLLAS
jgi:diacylglycerol kinase